MVTTPPIVDLTGCRILVVDDVAANRNILTTTLEGAGYSVFVAPNGEVALKIANANEPDLILLDVLMPGLNGFEVCEKLKENEKTQRIPVIFITANDGTDSVVRGFQAGAVDFISKPFKAEEVLARVATHLQINQLTKTLLQRNEELTSLNTQLKAESTARQQAENNLNLVVEGQKNPFHVSGTLLHDAKSYVERPADREILAALTQGEFCYVLTSRQMGKSSLMVRTANRLRDIDIDVASLDLTALGQNLTLEQWYDGMLARIGRRLGLENELDDYWLDNERISPVRRFFSAIRDVVLQHSRKHLVIFVDELDVVRSLPFAVDEFFAAIRECFNSRAEDPEMNRLTFCLIGVATPSDLIRDPSITLFNIGTQILLTDFTEEESIAFSHGFIASKLTVSDPVALVHRIHYWTNGHPYLTQRLCKGVAEHIQRDDTASKQTPEQLVDHICQTLFLSARSRDRDDNLIFVRERMLRASNDKRALFELYHDILNGTEVLDRDGNPLVSDLFLAGIVRSSEGRLKARNRIYQQIFDQTWVKSHLQ
jgi:DNA-binding response OmpR family regulator